MKTANPQDSYIGEQIRRERELRGIEQRKLAGKIKITISQLNKIEKGEERISPEIMHKIAGEMEIPVSVLYPPNKGDSEGALLASARDAEAPARHSGEIDASVGRKIREQRKLKKITQQQLGKHLGVSFQQIQKYEKGVNRVSFSFLIKISEFLGVPVAFFYPKAEHGGEERGAGAPDGVSVHCTPAEGNELMRAFMKIPDEKVRRRIIDLAKALSDSGYTL